VTAPSGSDWSPRGLAMLGLWTTYQSADALSVLLAPGASGRIPGEDADAIGADVSSAAAHARPATPTRRAERPRTVWCGWVVVVMSVLLVMPVG